MEDQEFEDWCKRQDEAHAMWERGATAKQVAEFLGINASTAQKRFATWKRKKYKGRIIDAAKCLHQNGFSIDEINVICGVSKPDLKQLLT